MAVYHQATARRCRPENVESEKSAQQCKNKMANLTKTYKTVKDKLRTTGYGKKGDDEHKDKETESGAELIPRNFHDMDNILGNREAVNPRHVLGSSSQHVDSSPKIDQDLLEKETLDEEMWAAARAQKERDTPGTSGADGSEEEDADMAFAKSLFFKNKSGKRKGPSTSTPNPKSRVVESAKWAKKNPREKTKGGAGAEEQGAVLSFLERAQEKDEAFMERIAEAERVSRQQQQKFSMDALAMLGNIFKDVTKGKE